MAISLDQVKNLILQYIGGYPLAQASRVFAEGRNIAYKAGGISAFVGLSSLDNLRALTTFGGISNILGAIPKFAQISGLLNKLENGILNIPGIGIINDISSLITQVQVGPLGMVTNYVNKILDGNLIINGIGKISSLVDLADKISSGILEIPGLVDISEAANLIDHIQFEGAGQFRLMTQEIVDGTLELPDVGNVLAISDTVSEVRNTGLSAMLQNPVSTVINSINTTIDSTLPGQLASLVSNGVITSGESTSIYNSLTTLSAYTDNLLTHTNTISGLGSPNTSSLSINSILGTANGSNQSFTVVSGTTSNTLMVYIGGLRNDEDQYSLVGNNVYITAPNTASIVVQYFSGISGTNYTLTDVLAVATSFGQDGGNSAIASGAITSISEQANTDLTAINTFVTNIYDNLNTLATTPALVIANADAYVNLVSNYITTDQAAYASFGTRVNDEGTISILLGNIQSTDNVISSIVTSVIKTETLNNIVQ